MNPKHRNRLSTVLSSFKFASILRRVFRPKNMVTYNARPITPPPPIDPNRFDHLPKHRIDLETGYPMDLLHHTNPFSPKYQASSAGSSPSASASTTSLATQKSGRKTPPPLPPPRRSFIKRRLHNYRRASLCTLPVELILEVAEYLDNPLDKICFRHTCSYTLKFTQLDHEFMHADSNGYMSMRNLMVRIRFLDMAGLGGNGIDKVQVIRKMRDGFYNNRSSGKKAEGDEEEEWSKALREGKSTIMVGRVVEQVL